MTLDSIRNSCDVLIVVMVIVILVVVSVMISVMVMVKETVNVFMILLLILFMVLYLFKILAIGIPWAPGPSDIVNANKVYFALFFL